MVSAIGKAFFDRHLSGQRLTPVEAIKANCYSCMGRYSDGKLDCNVPECPLHPFMPYRSAARAVEPQQAENTLEADDVSKARIRSK